MTDAIRSAKDFMSQWEVPDEQTLIKGSPQIPNLYKRQDRLVGQVLDACVILHVFETLQQPRSIRLLRQDLSSFLSDNFDGELLADIRKERDKDKQLAMLVKLSQAAPDAQNRLLTHHDMVNQKQWDKYIQNFQTYRKRASQVSDEAIEEAEAIHKSALPKDPKQDPRITFLNERIGQTIHIITSGPKEADSIARKSREKAIDIREMKDLNRVEILPRTPEYAADFIKIMERLNPVKEVHHQHIPRLFPEPPEVFKNGYFNQKLFLAMDRTDAKHTKNAPTQMTEDNLATIAEIKIIPPAMQTADQLSAITKPLLSTLKRFTKNYPLISTTPLDHEQMEKDYAAIQKLYLKQQKRFSNLTRHFGMKTLAEAWQEPFNTELDARYNCSQLYAQLQVLTNIIHHSAMLDEDKDWKYLYLKTAIRQERVKQGGDLNVQQHLSTDIPRTDTIENQYLRAIAEAGEWNLREIDDAVLSELAMERKRRGNGKTTSHGTTL